MASLLGPIQANFSIPQITIQANGQSLTLQEEPTASQATQNTIQHLLQSNAIALMHTLLFDHQPTLPMQNPPYLLT